MSEQQGDRAPGSAPGHGALPPGAGRLERLRLLVMGIGCLLPLPLILILQLGITLMYEVPGSATYLEIALVLLETGLIGAQAVTLAGRARSSIAGDQVDLRSLEAAKRTMAVLGVPVLVLAVPVAFVQAALLGALGFVFSVFFFLIGILGTTGRYLLGRLERLAVAAPAPPQH